MENDTKDTRAKARDIGSRAKARAIGPKEKAKPKARETKARAKDSKGRATTADTMGTQPGSAVRQTHSEGYAPSAVSGGTWQGTAESGAGYRKLGKTQKEVKKNTRTTTDTSASWRWAGASVQWTRAGGKTRMAALWTKMDGQGSRGAEHPSVSTRSAWVLTHFRVKDGQAHSKRGCHRCSGKMRTPSHPLT